MQATSLLAGSRVRARSVRVAGLCRAIAGTAIAVGLLAVPASASAADLTATTSTFSSVWSSAQGGDRILLASGSYGSFSGSGSKASTVTIAPQPGASASMSLSYNGASNIRVEGVTVTGLSIQGTTRNVTVADSLFTGQAVIRSGGAANANIVLDGNRHPNIFVGGCGTCYEGRIQVLSTGGSNPSGVTIKNSVLGPGGDADGIQNGADGVQILSNEFTGIRQISAVHSDSLQLYGSRNTVIRGNYFHDFDVAIMAPDGGSNEQITDNVMISSGGYRPAVQLGGHRNSVFAHNVTKNIDVFVDAKSGEPSGQNNIARDNVLVSGAMNVPASKCSNCTNTHNLFTSSGQSSGTNSAVGTPVFVGGSAPTAWAGYPLAAGSPGTGTASDGLDRGVRTDGSTPVPTPTPSPTPSPGPDAPAVAVWTAPSGATTGTLVTLDGTASTGDGTLTCAWSFEDASGGVWETVSGCKVTKTFQVADTKYVRLTVTDADGDTNASLKSFAVSVPAPAPSPTPTPVPPAPTPVPPAPTPAPVLPAPTPTPAPAGGLVASFGFDEASGATAQDSSGFANHGSVSGATRVSAGKHGKALRFDGTNDIVTVADSASLDLTNAMTLEAWVRPTALSTWRPIMIKERSSGEFSYMLYAHDESGRPAGWSRTGSDQVARGTGALATNAWSHVAVTYDGSTLRFYVNGVQKGSKAVTGNLMAGTGALRIGGSSVWREWFKGDLDDVRVWNKALSAAQITSDMSADGAVASSAAKLSKAKASKVSKAKRKKRRAKR